MKNVPIFQVTQATIHNINMYQSASSSESKTDSRTVKITATQKEALDKIVADTGYSSVSAFISDSIEFTINFLPVMEKLLRYEKPIKNFLSELP